MGSSASTNRVFNANQVLSRIYNTTKNYIYTREQTEDMVPSSGMYDTTELGYWVIDRNPSNQYTHYPFLTTYLSTAATSDQYAAAVAASTKTSSKSSNCSEVVSSTINWPGLDGSYIDEAEFDLIAGMRAATATVSTIGFFWQWKNSTATAWKFLSAPASCENSTGFTLWRYRGRAKTGAGYNKLPITVRLLFWAKTASKGAGKVRRDSYIKFKAKKTS